LIYNPEAYVTFPIGIVVRRQPGRTRWQRWHWTVSAVLPGAAPAAWRVLRREGDVTEYHAATIPLELHGAETEAYEHNLDARVPSLYVVMREGEVPFEILLVTASPYEAQDYTDSGEGGHPGGIAPLPAASPGPPWPPYRRGGTRTRAFAFAVLTFRGQVRPTARCCPARPPRSRDPCPRSDLS